jgi:UDPglucose 6-dehydrogenase
VSDREPIGVIGAGWVGLCTAACFAELGHEVWCRDIVPEKVEGLTRGELPIYEPGLDELVQRHRERLHFTTEMAELVENAQLLFCCVDTPPTYSGDADLSRVESVVRELGRSPDHALVMKSTVPVGTGRAIRRDSDGLAYVSNPEFLKEGTAIADFMHPDRVVIGNTDDSRAFGDRVAALYEPLDAPIVRTDVESAEMIKLASNAFLATKISFINEIANVSEELGADVTEVARGMGLDERIGPQFLRAGVGFGGSCLIGDETVLVRRQGRVWLWTLEEMWKRIAEEMNYDGDETTVLEPEELEVLSWRSRAERPEFLPVSVLTRRDYEGDILEIRTKMGRRVRCTPDHPFVVSDADGRTLDVKVAEDLDESDWLPLALGAPATERERWYMDPVALTLDAKPKEIIVRPAACEIEKVASLGRRPTAAVLDHPRGPARHDDIVRSGALRYDEAAKLGVSFDGATFATARNGTYMPLDIEMDEAFWRVVGLYIAEGCIARDRHGRPTQLRWAFHPYDEPHLVEEVAGFWRRHGMKARTHRVQTAMMVVVSSRLLAGWWIHGLGLGRNCYEQRIPDHVWSQPESDKRALLSGAWAGDGSWSYVTGGPSVVLEYGTASRQLADGILRLLGELGIVARWKVGRTAKSTCDNHWLIVAGANQVERVLEFVSPADRDAITASLARQAKRIAPTGYRRHTSGTAWLRVVKKERRRSAGLVYSVEVPDAHTFVTTGGLIGHNCFPKDVSALKQLAGNTGYHFQLLTAVIEVNELQKRRTIAKLQKHLGSLVGKEIALLGIAFKANTDDIREATSLVLAGRLQSEGANVRAYDPVAAESAREMLGGATVSESALGALDGADAAVLVTEWPEFLELDWAGEVKERMRTPLVVDGRNFLDAELLREAGFTYEGVGR